MIRYSRQVTGKKKVLVVDYCYHGSVDEAFATLDDSGDVVERRGNIGAPVAPSETTVVVPFNDVSALEEAFPSAISPVFDRARYDQHRHKCCPTLVGTMKVRALCTLHGAVLIIDETHTICAGPADDCPRFAQPRCCRGGKTIGGGVPAGAYGMTAELQQRVRASIELEDIDVGGVGGTLAGNALSTAGIRATLGHVLTPEAYPSMIARASEWTSGVQEAIEKFSLPWQVTQLGGRAEYSFLSRAPRNGAEAARADDFELGQYLHLHALNRGVLLTPFHNMALMSPVTTTADVTAHTAHFWEAVESLVG